MTSGAEAMALGLAKVRFTDRGDGDLSNDAVGVDERRRAVVDAPWSWLNQVHGGSVWVVDRPGAAVGAAGDGLVTSSRRAPLAVTVADCAPVAFASRAGVVGVAHAGWRGLVAGVLEATVAEVRRVGADRPGAERVIAALGPCIHPCCYEFGADLLDAVAGRVGEEVRATNARGSATLDLPVAVRIILDRLDVPLVQDVEVCTASSSTHWSHRQAGDQQRQAVVAWLP